MAGQLIHYHVLRMFMTSYFHHCRWWAKENSIVLAGKTNTQIFNEPPSVHSVHKFIVHRCVWWPSLENFIYCTFPEMRACPQFRKSGQPSTPYEKNVSFGGVKHKKSWPNFFCGSWMHIKNTFCKKIGSKRPFQPSAVVRTIYRRLYGVATAN